MKKFDALIFITLLIFPAAVFGVETPKAVVKKHIEEVLKVLGDPSLVGEAGKKIKEKKVHEIAEEMFDFKILSKRSLGRRWKELDPNKQMEFVDLYKSLLKNAYTDRIISYDDEKINFGKEISYSDKIVEVQTTLVTKTDNIPINYRLIKIKGQWKVYDVIIEGVSLITTYRNQFREVLANKSLEDLFEILRKKVNADENT